MPTIEVPSPVDGVQALVPAIQDHDAEASVPRAGPGLCIYLSRNAASHCVVHTQCQDSDITHYSLRLICDDGRGGRTRHVFEEGSFAIEETFDTLIVCASCLPDEVPAAPLPAVPVSAALVPPPPVEPATSRAETEVPIAKAAVPLAATVDQLEVQVEELKEGINAATAAVRDLQANAKAQAHVLRGAAKVAPEEHADSDHADGGTDSGSTDGDSSEEVDANANANEVQLVEGGDGEVEEEVEPDSVWYGTQPKPDQVEQDSDEGERADSDTDADYEQ